MGTAVADESVVNWRSPTGTVPSGACLAFERLWIGLGSTLVAYDLISGMVGPRVTGFGANASPRFVQPYGNYLAVACDDKRLYTVDPNTGDISPLAYVGDLNWMAAYQGSIFVAGTRGLYRVARPEESVQTPYGPLVGPFGQGNLGGDPTMVDGVIYVPLNDNSRTVAALDAMTLREAWNAEADGAVGAAYCDGATLAFATENRTLYLYDVQSRANIKKLSLNSEVVGAPLLANDYAYVALKSRLVMVVASRSNAIARSFELPYEPLDTGVLNENGLIFYRSESQIIALDPTAASTSGVESYKTNAWPMLADYAHGALFYADSQIASAIRLDETIHDYYAESSLIRDFNFQASTGNPDSKPNFQVQIALFTNDGSPRSNQLVRIAATSVTEVQYQGQRHTISRKQFLDVKTDGVGRFRLAVAAGTTDGSGAFQEGLSAPELLLSSPYMDPEMVFVVRPNAELQDHLTTIKADQLAQAKGYDETPVITDEYRNDRTALGHATSAINESAGMVRGSMSTPRKRDMGNRYCDPACDMAVACCMPADNPSTNVVCSQPYSFDIRIGASHFRHLSLEEAKVVATSLHASLPQSWIGDFWDDIKTRAAKIVGAVVQTVAEGAHAAIKAIKNGVEYAVEFVIDTIDKAVLFVQGIFNAIATAMKRVIEAVSFLFDWKAVLNLQTQIRAQVEGAWDDLERGSNGISFDSLKTALNDTLNTAKIQMDSSFEVAKAALGMRSPLSAQQDATKRPNSAIGSSKNDWLLAKFKDHALPEIGVQAGSLALSTAVSWPAFDPGNAVIQAFDAFSSRLGDSVSADVKATIDRMMEDLDFQSSPGFLARSLAAILDTLRGIADVAVDVVQAVGNLAIDLLKAIISALRSFVTATIGIPYITEFYRWATGKDLCLIDLMSLLVAIPAGFALKLVSDDPAYASGVSPARPTVSSVDDRSAAGAARSEPTQGWLMICAGASQAIWGFLNGITSSIDLWNVQKYGEQLPDSGLSFISKARITITGTAWIVVRGLFAASLAAGAKTRQNYLAWFDWLFPTVVMAIDVIVIKVKKSNPDVSLSVFIGSALLGATMIVMGIVMIALDHDQLDQWIGFAFTMCAGAAMIVRGLILLKDPKVQYLGIAATALLIMISGAVEIVRGAELKAA
jgi:hypothetical protein